MSVFIQFYTASSEKAMYGKMVVTVVQGHSRSSKMVPIESPVRFPISLPFAIFDQHVVISRK